MKWPDNTNTAGNLPYGKTKRIVYKQGSGGHTGMWREQRRLGTLPKSFRLVFKRLPEKKKFSCCYSLE